MVRFENFYTFLNRMFVNTRKETSVSLQGLKCKYLDPGRRYTDLVLFFLNVKKALGLP